jgi:hypothetical protein
MTLVISGAANKKNHKHLDAIATLLLLHALGSSIWCQRVENGKHVHFLLLVVELLLAAAIRHKCMCCQQTKNKEEREDGQPSTKERRYSRGKRRNARGRIIFNIALSRQMFWRCTD